MTLSKWKALEDLVLGGCPGRSWAKAEIRLHCPGPKPDVNKVSVGNQHNDRMPGEAIDEAEGSVPCGHRA